MELGTVALIALVVWYCWSQHTRQARERAYAERRKAELRASDEKRERDESLAHLEIRSGDDLWTFDFVHMNVTTVWLKAPETGENFYHLRRSGDGRWEGRISEARGSAELDRLRKEYAELEAGKPL